MEKAICTVRHPLNIYQFNFTEVEHRELIFNQSNQ